MLAGGAFLLSRSEVERLFRAAPAGEKIVYARGRELPRGETSAYVRQLYTEGRADLHQVRSEAGFDFIVKPLGRAAAGGEGGPVQEEDPALEAVYRLLAEAAEAGEKCPTDGELARRAGLATRNAAAWRVRKLEREGRIAVETVQAGPHARHRTVVIRETKARTLGPGERKS